ncbi:MAG TPA: hypothetical protein VNY84_00530 [Acidimicrobiales bacterium]|nr:hypothetical protein [Acidimicrobiales bacterium]
MSDESGQVAGIEGLVFGLLIFIVGTLIVANAWGVIDAKMAASSAAREAARTYVKAPAGSDALGLAVAAGTDTLHSLGRRGSDLRVELVAGTFARCSTVTFRVSVPVPLLKLPWLGSHGTGFTAVASHTEIVDPYRSGVAGDPELKGAANCG